MSKDDEKSLKIRAWGSANRRKWGPEVPSRGNKTWAWKNKGVLLTPCFPFHRFCGKWEPRWRPKSLKNQKMFQNWMIFLIGFWMHFGRDLGTKMNEKSLQKRCQKHVGIDLEVEVANTQQMIPLTSFLIFLEVKLGPKSIKNRRTIDPKSSEFSDQVFGSISYWFLKPFWEPRWRQNRWQKVLRKWWKNDDDQDGKKVEYR